MSEVLLLKILSDHTESVRCNIHHVLVVGVRDLGDTGTTFAGTNSLPFRPRRICGTYGSLVAEGLDLLLMSTGRDIWDEGGRAIETLNS
jgi:hypothetical protein